MVVVRDDFGFGAQFYTWRPEQPLIFEFPADLLLISNDPDQIVADALQALSAAIKGITDFARPVLPASEERRLDALSDTLDMAGRGLELGQFDTSTAKSMVKTGLALAFAELGGIGLGALFASIGRGPQHMRPCRHM